MSLVELPERDLADRRKYKRRETDRTKWPLVILLLGGAMGAQAIIDMHIYSVKNDREQRVCVRR